ncbi:peptide deformylase [Geomonas sp. RF6]|uniref:peptide deformylase n=1 Tax=Geomonas sp. RF6 TaxID=2897342 RepID=UPI001E63B2B7|nr:peptide deformylase [Geomonas sp. RF6]UFS68701.1 peptide deformylase [Geomonas sp. RF6]
MAIIRQIAQLGRPVLRKVAAQVENHAAPEIRSLVEDMLLTVVDANGVGLAAPQVHESVQLFIIAPRPNPRYPNASEMDPIIMMNPKLLWGSEEMEKGWEGCLSIPGIRGFVPRHKSIRVAFLGADGTTREAELEGFVARIFQHEYDHLQGVVFLDRTDPRELVMEKEYLHLMMNAA